MNGHGSDDLGLVIPHQENRRLIETVGERLHLRKDQVYIHIDRVGNTSAASIPIALSQAKAEGRLKSRQILVMPVMGAGWTWGAGREILKRGEHSRA